MGQIITLLTNLFNLTKVASVTLPGLLSAGGLALILWPAVPIDVIPFVFHVSHTRTFDIAPDVTCAGENGLGRHDAFARSCQVVSFSIDDAKRYIALDQEQLRKRIQDLKNSGGEPAELAELADDEAEYSRNQFAIEELEKTEDPSLPASRKKQIREQLLLDLEDQSFSECTELETSRKGREEAENDQLKADLVIEEQKRTAAQTNYLAALTSNSSVAGQYRTEMNYFEGCITLKRYTTLWNNEDINERGRRLTELSRQQKVIEARLTDPGRLRPRTAFDDFLTGLVNHVVGFILLSLAAAIIVTAIDNALFGALFEDLFDGF